MFKMYENVSPQILTNHITEYNKITRNAIELSFYLFTELVK